MLHSVKHLYGHKLRAVDGGVGHVKDFYFDEQSWVMRYLVADTGSWLPGRQVLIAPHAFVSLDWTGELLLLDLTRKQIEDSPSIETHKPVSRQYEEAFYRYYGWPYYWEGSGLWGMSGFPVLELPPGPLRREPATGGGGGPQSADAHLRSAQAVKGYHVQATDAISGHLCDFLMEAHTWAIRQLVVKIGHRLSGREVQIPTSSVDRINYEKSTVFVNLTTNAVEHCPARLLPATDATV